MRPLARAAAVRASASRGSCCDDLGIPACPVGLLNHPTTFDAAQAQALLAPAGIRVPPPGRRTPGACGTIGNAASIPVCTPPPPCSRCVRGKMVLVTGGSSGIGRATALRLAEAGARLLIVARDEQRLASVRAEIEARDGRVTTYSCDIGDGRSVRPPDRPSAGRAWACGYSDQQRRALDPARASTEPMTDCMIMSD